MDTDNRVMKIWGGRGVGQGRRGQWGGRGTDVILSTIKIKRRKDGFSSEQWTCEYINMFVKWFDKQPLNKARRSGNCPLK